MFSLALSWVIYSRQKQIAVLWGRPVGRDKGVSLDAGVLRPANSHLMHLGKASSLSPSCDENLAPGNSLPAISWKTLSQRQQAKLHLKSWSIIQDKIAIARILGFVSDTMGFFSGRICIKTILGHLSKLQEAFWKKSINGKIKTCSIFLIKQICFHLNWGHHVHDRGASPRWLYIFLTQPENCTLEIKNEF